MKMAERRKRREDYEEKTAHMRLWRKKRRLWRPEEEEEGKP